MEPTATARFRAHEGKAPGGLFESLACLLEALESLPLLSDASIVDEMLSCTELLPAFEVLLCGNTEDVAPRRVLLMQDASRAGFWVCRAAVRNDGGGGGITSGADGKAGGGAQFYLRYESVQNDPSSEIRHDLNELLDFQSALVLGREDKAEHKKALSRQGAQGVADPTDAAVERFTAQLAWMRRVSAALEALAAAGSFAYSEFDVMVPLTESVAEASRGTGYQDTDGSSRRIRRIRRVHQLTSLARIP